LAAAGQDDELFVRFLVDVLDLDHDVARHLNVTELLGNRQVIDHRPPDHCHLALVASGGVERLLDPVDIGCEGRDDDPARALAKKFLERLTDGAFGWSNPSRSALVLSDISSITPWSPKWGGRAMS